MKQVRVLVLGGGLAGLIGAYSLQKSLRRRHAVTLISASARLELRQSLSRTVFGLEREGKGVDLAEALSSQGISFRQVEISRIRPGERVVETAAGAMEYDRLLVALGAKWEKRAVRGASENAFFIGSLKDALVTRDALNGFEGESFSSVVAPGNKWEGPALETVFLAHKLFTDQGLRGKMQINFVTYKNRPFEEYGKAATEAIERELAGRGISLLAGVQATEVRKDAVAAEGREIPSEFTVLFPSYSGSDAIAGSGLGDGKNFVPVDEFMRARNAPAVFAAGDCINSNIVKLGFNALSGASVAGANIAREVLGKQQLKRFDPKIVYVMELGGGEGLLITGFVTGGEWLSRATKGSVQYLKKRSFEKTFLKKAGLVNYVMGEKIA